MNRIIFILTLIASFAIAINAQVQAPSGLLCELLSHPENAVITDAKPEFAWIVNDARRGAKQSAYQILVASSAQRIAAEHADIWDSGKVQSDESVNVEYAGKDLSAHTSYWWKVRTWDASGKPSAWSVAQKFNVGDLQRNNLKFPSESRWQQLGNDWVFENRHPIRYQEIAPVKITQKANGHFFVDFGKAAFATIKLTLTSNADKKIEIHLGEKLSDATTIDPKPGGNIAYKKVELQLKQGTHEYLVELPRQVSHYPNSQVLAEHMPEVYPFRYVEIVGSLSILTTKDIRQYALFYQFDDNAAQFTSSNSDLNRVWDICKYTMKATPFLGVYSDGTRERMPYEADAYIQMLGHYSVDREFAIQRYTHEFLIFNPAWPTEWHLHSVLMAWADFMATGNKESLNKYYTDLQAKSLQDLTEANGLISTRTGKVTPEFFKKIHYVGNQFRDIVDWPQAPKANPQPGDWTSPLRGGETDEFVFTDYNAVVNAFHYRNLVLLSRIAKVLQRADEAQQYQARAEKFKTIFQQSFFDPQRKIFVDGIGANHAALHTNMFAFAFGLTPPEARSSVQNFIKSRGMMCSVYGSQYLLEALYDGGEAQHALDLMTAKTDRSWLHMIDSGSTMTWEAWDFKYKPNLDWNHAWGAAPANIIVRDLIGITPLEPAHKRIQIKPQVGNLKFAKLKTPTIRGTVFADWKTTAHGFMFDVTIPANTTAEVYLPTTKPNIVKESGAPISKNPNVKLLRAENNFAVFEINAGHYSFSVNN